MSAQYEQVQFAVVGGTGVYNVEGLEDVVEVKVDTPFGSPSDTVRIGTLDGVRVAFLPRHGRGHKHLPSEINFRANIYALKLLGVKYLLSVSVCGSLQEKNKPLDIVVPDQFLDFTRKREQSFFGNGCVAHVAMADPVCPAMAQLVYEAASSAVTGGSDVHMGGTYTCIEGPAFSTKAESNMYRILGGSIIGMTGIPEAKLAREAEIAYAMVALITDYDCWHPDHDGVTVELVIENLKQCAKNAQGVVRACINKIAANPPVSAAHEALKFSLLTPLASFDAETRARLDALVSKYDAQV